VIGKTVRGAAHARAELENQDAMNCLPDDRAGSALIVAVSDGHGSAKCFRSQIGAQLAVKLALAVVEAFLERSAGSELSALHRCARTELPKQLARQWQERVRTHLEQQPITEADAEILRQKAGVTAVQAVHENPLLAYGTTLLAVAITESFILYLQLGDGEILTVSDLGDVGRPLPRDDALIANETTSLCLPDAAQRFRVHLEPLSDRPPALILLCTDGLPNSFAEEAGFLRVGTDLLKAARAEGLQQVEGQLETWLRQVSEQGSGDDMTVAVICRSDALGATGGKEGPEADESRELQAGPQTIDVLAAEALLVPPTVEGAGETAQARPDGGAEPPNGSNERDNRRAERTTREVAAVLGAAP
jgi:serine/threonine protein phosphatase PrpC